MDYSNHKIRFNELIKYQDNIRNNTELSDREKVCSFLAFIDDSVDYSVLSESEIIGILNELSQANKEISSDIRTYIDFIESLNRMIDKFLEEIGTVLKPAMESFSKISASVTASVTAEITNSMKEFSKKIQESMRPFWDVFKAKNLKEHFDWVDDYIIIASEYEWVIYDNMEISDLRSIVDIHNNTEYISDQKKKCVDDLYMSYLHDDVVEQIMKSLIQNNRLFSMQHILDEIQFAFLHRRYYLCCATLIPLIEGAVFDTFDGEFYCKQERFLNQIKSLSDSKLSSIVLSIIEFKLFSNFLYGQELESNISRHAIMHGFDRKYGTKVTFCKLLLLFSTLIDWLDASDNVT